MLATINKRLSTAIVVSRFSGRKHRPQFFEKKMLNNIAPSKLNMAIAQVLRDVPAETTQPTADAHVRSDYSAPPPADLPARQEAIPDARQARRHAKRIWKAATRAPETHWFMRLGGIQPHGLRVGSWKFKDGKEIRDSVGELLIPIRDHRGVLQSLRCVPGTCMGDQMLPGSVLRGNYFSFGDGLKRNPAGQAVMYFLTDFCAAATIFEVTGYCTLCCFEDQNLLFVAQAISKGRQLAGAEALEMVFIDGSGAECDDTSKAREAAFALDGYFVPPPFEQFAHDLPRVRVEQGPEAVWEILASRVKASAERIGGAA